MKAVNEPQQRNHEHLSCDEEVKEHCRRRSLDSCEPRVPIIIKLLQDRRSDEAENGRGRPLVAVRESRREIKSTEIATGCKLLGIGENARFSVLK